MKIYAVYFCGYEGSHIVETFEKEEDALALTERINGGKTEDNSYAVVAIESNTGKKWVNEELLQFQVECDRSEWVVKWRANECTRACKELGGIWSVTDWFAKEGEHNWNFFLLAHNLKEAEEIAKAKKAEIESSGFDVALKKKDKTKYFSWDAPYKFLGNYYSGDYMSEEDMCDKPDYNLFYFTDDKDEERA